MTIETKSRFKLLDIPVAVPGNCIICGSVGGDGRKFIDIGITLEFTGVVYFCTECMSECLTVMGFIKPEQFAAVQGELEAQKIRLKETEDERERFRTIADASAVLGSYGSGTSLRHVSDSDGVDEESSDSVESKSGDVEGSSESPNGGRRKNVPNHASHDKVVF